MDPTFRLGEIKFIHITLHYGLFPWKGNCYYSLIDVFVAITINIHNKVYGEDNREFRCELTDSESNTWTRAIQVQVIGRLESVADCKKGVGKNFLVRFQFLAEKTSTSLLTNLFSLFD